MGQPDTSSSLTTYQLIQFPNCAPSAPTKRLLAIELLAGLMEQVWKYYNTLPTLLEANERFKNREQIFSALTQLLSTYDNAFSICLIHAHCELSEGEIMLVEENVSQPVHVSNAPPCYAESWLPSGQPYEFTTHPTHEPPSALVKEFQVITGTDGVLGLHYVGFGSVDKDPVVQLEWTEGRKNFMRRMRQEDWEQEAVVGTAWNFGKSIAATVFCAVFCVSQTTHSGHLHTGEEFKFIESIS